MPDTVTGSSSLVEDTDDDNDGLLDTVDAEPLIPGIVAPFKVVSVISTNQPGSEDFGEVFDVSSAGRMLPYAYGSDAYSGYGRLFGGIYFNHDGTNLYIGVAGYSKKETTEGENALLLVLDTKSGGVSGMNAITSGPKGLSVCDNLRFQSGTFVPDVGILVGNRNSDGWNDPDAILIDEWNNPQEYGQGVYALSGSAATNLAPAFTDSGPSPISQWGDTPYSTNLANAGIEIAIPLSNILDSAWSSTSTTIIQVAAIVMGGTSGGDRHLSSEAYGKSASGGFGFNNTTLLGESVYLSPNAAPEPKTTPMFTDSEVMLQGFGWNVPRVPETYFNTMSVVGSFNGWPETATNMTPIGDDVWEYTHDFTPAVTNIQFKFVANQTWGSQWGETNQTDVTLPVDDENQRADWDTGTGEDIEVVGVLNGLVRFRFTSTHQNEKYSVESVTNDALTYLAGFSDIPWYERLKQQAESNDFAKFDRVWMNPPQKGKSGKYSVGYDPFDYFDLGTYDQNGTVETRYGTEAQLKDCMQAFAAKGIDCLADMVLNHMNNNTNTYRYDYIHSHQTFEKRNSGTGDTNGYFNINYKNEPFQYDNGWGLPAGTNASDPFPGAHSADVNERHPYMRNGIKNNGNWLQTKVGYRGCRFDYTQGMEPWFFAEYMRVEALIDTFGVGEFWADVKDATPREHQTWISLMDNRVCSFDFPLHEKLAEMCNSPATFDMEDLSHGALIHVDPERAVTFVESHDEIRPFGNDDKEGMKQDKELAYAFILMSEGHPCVFGQDYLYAPYADTDEDGTGWTGDPLKPQIDPLIDARDEYAGGTTTYLSTANKDDLFIAKRNGTDTKDGCIFVINDDMTQTLTNTVNTGWAQNTVLVDALETNHTVTVQAGGMAPLSATNRSYRVYVRQ